MTKVILICNDYYEVVDNSDCNAADDYNLIYLGPYISYDTHQALQNGGDELPF